MQTDSNEKFSDFSSALPNLRIVCVFDVGANIGDTVTEVIDRYPHSIVHAFEPVTKTFLHLSKRFSGSDQVHCHKFALGASSGEALITARGTATGNHIVEKPPKARPVERIVTKKGDDVIETLQTQQVSFLKVDTEGYDLEVLRGFEKTLRSQRIDVFQVEVGMSTENFKHVNFRVLQDFSESLGYRLFRIYNQAYELDGRPIARRADAIFLSPDCIIANTAPKARKSLFKRVVPSFLR